MEEKEYAIIGLEEIFGDHGIEVDAEVLEEIAEAFISHMDAYHEATGQAHVMTGPSPLEIRVNELEEKIEKERIWLATTKACEACGGKGGFDVNRPRMLECDECGGRARTEIHW